MIIAQHISEIHANLKSALGPNARVCLALSTSNERSNLDPFLGGCRIFHDLAIVSMINIGQHSLSNLIPLLKELQFYKILADTDKKHPFDIDPSSIIYFSNLVSELEHHNFDNVIPFSSTKLTTDSVVNSLTDSYGYNLSGMKMSVVGLGAIGFQLSLELVRQGVSVNVSSRDHSKGRRSVECINFLKSEYTLASSNYFNNIKTALSESDVLIDCSCAIDLYDNSYIPYFSRLSQIISVSKSSFTSHMITNLESQVKILRADVSPELISLVASDSKLVRSNFQASSKIYGNNRLICNGFKGIPGDIVVNDTIHPAFVLGVVNQDYKLDPIYKSFEEWSKI